MRRLLAGVAAIVLIGVVGYVGLALAMPRQSLDIDYYRVVDSTTIVVGTHSSPDTWNRASVTVLPSSIQVIAEASNWPFMLARGIASPMELTVSLPEPIGDRSVTGSDGRAIANRE